MEIIKDISQQTEIWFDLRAKRMTASNAQAIGNAGAGLDTYINEMMAQYYSKSGKSYYTNADLERGIIREPQAKFVYSAMTGNEIENVCFVIKNDYVGASPDGFIGNDGLFECKAPSDTNYFKLLLEYKQTGNFKIKPEYIWQMQMQMEVCEREWVDFVNYNPNFEENLLIKRIYADKTYFDKLKIGYEIGSEKIKEIQSNMESLCITKA